MEADFPSSWADQRTAWQNRSPGDLSIVLPEIVAGDVAAAIEAAAARRPDVGARRRCRSGSSGCARRSGCSRGAKDELARGIALETGKPLTEALGEVGAVIAKIDLTIDDAEQHLAERTESRRTASGVGAAARARTGGGHRAVQFSAASRARRERRASARGQSGHLQTVAARGECRGALRRTDGARHFRRVSSKWFRAAVRKARRSASIRGCARCASPAPCRWAAPWRKARR